MGSYPTKDKTDFRVDFNFNSTHKLEEKGRLLSINGLDYLKLKAKW